MLYASPIWAAAAVTHLKRLHTFQNIQLRRAANAPWFVRNEVLHKDLNVPPLLDFIKNNQKISSTGYHRFQMNLSGKSRPYDNSIPSSSKRLRAVLNHSYQHFPALKRIRMS
ncbi:RNA-directed DNA polymerase from mobile element jockey [Trichonephila clavipes]|nr:RNA-directed DNA polymerase from mobile element jockey [Trichonephila clavipes]